MSQATEDSLRLFIGARVPEMCRIGVSDLQEAWYEHDWFRWTTQENLHLTVLFLGNVPKDLLENLIRMFRDGYARMAPFELRNPGWTWGPSEAKARMLWIRYSKSREFSHLVQQSSQWFEQILPYPQQRLTPLPHITVARFRQKDRDPALELPTAFPDVPFQLDRLVLWKSEPGPAGSTYLPLTHFNLGPG